MSNLQLSLKTKWFELTKSGVKTEDYREINDYWVSRLCLKHKNNVIVCGADLTHKHSGSQFSLKHFKTNTMTLGYPKKGDSERILRLEHKGIEIRTGNPDWGAEPDKLYFVILHGSVVE